MPGPEIRPPGKIPTEKMAYKDFVNDRNKGILKDVLLFYGAEDF